MNTIPKFKDQFRNHKLQNRLTRWSVLLLAFLSFFCHRHQCKASDSYSIPRISPVPSEVSGVDTAQKRLDGTWKFNSEFRKGYELLRTAESWEDITVPGEWAMQGFHVKAGEAAGYFRTFMLPAEWSDKRIKIRFNGVYSETAIYINGVHAGAHLGGFTAFELDITDLVTLREANTLILAVKNESLADSLASGSKYACHPLGGITRSITLFALPELNLSSLAVRTRFDSVYRDATLTALVEISNESKNDINGARMVFELSPWESDAKILLEIADVDVGKLGPGDVAELEYSVLVKEPLQWNCEDPNLYVLTCKLERDGVLIETVRQRFGFRQSEVRGNQLLINGRPVKLRGVNRHEVYPLTGRVVPAEMYRKDIEVFREGNVNHIRTCHYPPDQQLMEAADELGMFIECEGPFCWSHNTKGNPEVIGEAITGQLLEMLVSYRNHPSIIFWSMANESHWNDLYDYAGKAMAKLDPTRPITFNFFPWSWGENRREDEHICRIGSDHYPGPEGPSKYANYDRPVSFGEYVHLNAYNRYELATDVALRDKWGIYLYEMWEDMYKSRGCAGGSIWAGIDDTFYWDYINEDGSVEERTVGYGTWGPIDGWRRRKPEWWGMKKTYSPVRVSLSEYPRDKVVLEVENRQDFSNLDRLNIRWQIGNESGTVSADVPPKQKGELIIEPLNIPKPNAYLELSFDDPRGFNVDTFKFQLEDEEEAKVVDQLMRTYKVKRSGSDILVKGINKEYLINSNTGLFQTPEFTGPHLMILPMNDEGDTQMHGPDRYYEPFTQTCTDWKLQSITSEKIGGLPVITVHGAYKEAEGKFTYAFNADGTLTIDYNFISKEKVSPRQMGIVFELPKDFEKLSWKRNGYWSTYPSWHIARLEGTAMASEGVEATPVGPRSKPRHEWRHDRTAIGSNDFSSTKHNIYTTSLLNELGHGMRVIGNGDIHTRSWIDAASIRLLVADYSNGGSERFLRSHAKIEDKLINIGDQLAGRFILMID